jgi:hypothetical protein
VYIDVLFHVYVFFRFGWHHFILGTGIGLVQGGKSASPMLFRATSVIEINRFFNKICNHSELK